MVKTGNWLKTLKSRDVMNLDQEDGYTPEEPAESPPPATNIFKVPFIEDTDLQGTATINVDAFAMSDVSFSMTRKAILAMVKDGVKAAQESEPRTKVTLSTTLIVFGSSLKNRKGNKNAEPIMFGIHADLLDDYARTMDDSDTATFTVTAGCHGVDIQCGRSASHVVTFHPTDKIEKTTYTTQRGKKIPKVVEKTIVATPVIPVFDKDAKPDAQPLDKWIMKAVLPNKYRKEDHRVSLFVHWGCVGSDARRMHYDSALQFIPHTFIEPYGYRDILDDNVKGTLVGAVDAEALRTAFAQFTAHRDDGISMDFKKDKIDLVYDGLSLTRKLSIPFRLKSPLKFVPFARIGHVIDAFSAFEGKVTIRVRDAVSISFYCGTRTAITMLMRKE